MFHRWAALVLVLALCAMTPKNAAGQTQSNKPREPSAGKLKRNFPNPINPETRFEFDVGADACIGASERHAVSLHIFNVLSVQVATPVLEGVQSSSITPIPTSLQAQLRNLRLGCGHYVAYWNGKLDRSGKEAPSGPYTAALIVDGKLANTIKIFVSK